MILPHCWWEGERTGYFFCHARRRLSDLTGTFWPHSASKISKGFLRLRCHPLAFDKSLEVFCDVSAIFPSAGSSGEMAPRGGTMHGLDCRVSGNAALIRPSWEKGGAVEASPPQTGASGWSSTPPVLGAKLFIPTESQNFAPSLSGATHSPRTFHVRLRSDGPRGYLFFL